MPNSSHTTDFSFRLDRTGKPVVTSGAEHVRTVLTMLFGMEPGTDEYEPERGLDLMGRKNRTYVDMTRDTEYESMISEQLTKYTDLLPLNIIAVYANQTLYINLSVQYQANVYTIQMSDELDANLDSLSSMLININDFNRR